MLLAFPKGSCFYFNLYHTSKLHEGKDLTSTAVEPYTKADRMLRANNQVL